MLLTDFYRIFPEYKPTQFSIRYVRNEIYVVIANSSSSFIVLDYFNDDHINIILRDKRFIFPFPIRNQLHKQFNIMFDSRLFPVSYSKLSTLKSDYLNFYQLILKTYQGVSSNETRI